MCVICVKNKGVNMPDADTIETMWVNNPDGAGIMYTKRGRVHIDKGFMTLAALNKRLRKLGDEIDMKKETVVLHFRIGTSGGNIPQNTHPFPLSGSVNKLRKLRSITEVGIAHNGVIPITPHRKDISDTMEYIVSEITKYYRHNRYFYRNTKTMAQIKDETRSRLVFLTGDGNTYLVGDWVTDKDTGLLYSNTSYKYDRYTRYYYPGYTWTPAKKHAYSDYYYDDYHYSSYLYPDEDDKPWYSYDTTTNHGMQKASTSLTKSDPEVSQEAKKIIEDYLDTVCIRLCLLEEGDYIVDHETGSFYEGADPYIFMFDNAGNLYVYDEDDKARIVLGDVAMFDISGLEKKYDPALSLSIEVDFEHCFTLTDLYEDEDDMKEKKV